MEVLQTSALPLGYVAASCEMKDGSRARDLLSGKHNTLSAEILYRRASRGSSTAASIFNESNALEFDGAMHDRFTATRPAPQSPPRSAPIRCQWHLI